MPEGVGGEADEHEAGRPQDPDLVASIESAQRADANQPHQDGIGREEAGETAGKQAWRLILREVGELSRQ